MIALLIILILLLVVALALIIFKREWFDSLFGNSVIRKVEKKKKLEGQLAVLRQQQKIEAEKISKETEKKKADLVCDIDAQITSYEASINNLKKQKKTQQDLLDEQKRVEMDKKIHEFDRKIVSKVNEIKRLGHFIEAERKNQDDALNPDQPNAPKKILLEDK